MKAAMSAEPGDRAPAPEPVRLVQRFINTWDREGVELLDGPGALRDWFAEAGLLANGVALDGRDFRRALDVREALRELVAGNAALAYDPAAVEVVNDAARRAGLHTVLVAPAESTHRVTASGIDSALGEIVAVVHESIAAGTWSRLKACERSTCRWAFYDRSRNASGHWCSMAVCGSREKNRRAYRRRRNAA
jgi:predicted RNA-binding Zn ribbon-like protein